VFSTWDKQLEYAFVLCQVTPNFSRVVVAVIDELGITQHAFKHHAENSPIHQVRIEHDKLKLPKRQVTINRSHITPKNLSRITRQLRPVVAKGRSNDAQVQILTVQRKELTINPTETQVTNNIPILPLSLALSLHNLTERLSRELHTENITPKQSKQPNRTHTSPATPT